MVPLSIPENESNDSDGVQKAEAPGTYGFSRWEMWICVGVAGIWPNANIANLIITIIQLIIYFWD